MSLIRRMGGKIRRLAGGDPARRLDPVVRIGRILRNQENAYVVQIGSNDGVANDPIHQLLLAHPGWEALLVEPVPFLFERLRQNYPNQARFRFENVAISDQPGTLPFYYVAEGATRKIADLPHWHDQLGSFDPDHIRRHFGNRLDAFIVKTQIATVSMPMLLERHRVPRIDLLHIDAEGSDWMILRQVDLVRFAPRIILFEHAHLSETDKQAAREFLSKRYRIADLGMDFICVRRPRLSALLRR